MRIKSFKAFRLLTIYLRPVRKICSSLIEEDVLSRVKILTRRWRFHLNISCWPYWWLLRIFGGLVTLVAAVQWRSWWGCSCGV